MFSIKYSGPDSWAELNFSNQTFDASIFPWLSCPVCAGAKRNFVTGDFRGPLSSRIPIVQTIASGLEGLTWFDSNSSSEENFSDNNKPSHESIIWQHYHAINWSPKKLKISFNNFTGTSSHWSLLLRSVFGFSSPQDHCILTFFLTLPVFWA